MLTAETFDNADYLEPVIDFDMPLSDHFTLRTMLRPPRYQRYRRRALPNIPLKRHITAMQNLCRRVLEPVCRYFGLPLEVLASFKCKLHNNSEHGCDDEHFADHPECVDGKPEACRDGLSQHCDGLAADITIARRHWPFYMTTSEQAARVLYRWMRDCLDTYDVLALVDGGDRWWVHVSCRVDDRRNRHLAFETKLTPKPDV